MSLNETISTIKSNVADAACLTMYGKNVQELIAKALSDLKRVIDYPEFVEIAKSLGAEKILEKWDEETFHYQNEALVPMTVESAVNLCELFNEERKIKNRG